MHPVTCTTNVLLTCRRRAVRVSSFQAAVSHSGTVDNHHLPRVRGSCSWSSQSSIRWQLMPAGEHNLPSYRSPANMRS
jgi:hypothetical protein